jgi:hypothetical protein
VIADHRPRLSFANEENIVHPAHIRSHRATASSIPSAGQNGFSIKTIKKEYRGASLCRAKKEKMSLPDLPSTLTSLPAQRHRVTICRPYGVVNNV